MNWAFFYVQPYVGRQNAGYILVDLDRAQPTVIATMRAHGHDPCVVLQTGSEHQQAWVQTAGRVRTRTLAVSARREARA